MNIFVAILALSFLIIVHEFGHFIVAKLSGIKVLEFSLFMGPKLVGFQKGETLYSIRLIPLGGYVKMEGEEAESNDDRAYNRKPVHIRAAVIAAGPIMNLVIAVLIYLLITAVAGYSTNKVEFVEPESPAYMAGIQKGDQILSYDGKTVYRPMDYQIALLMSKGKTADVEIKRGNEIKEVNLVPEIIPANRYIIGYSPKKGFGEGSNEIASVSEGGPASKAGLKKGDRIVNLNGTEVSSYRDIRSFIKQNQGNKIDVTVLRNGETKKFTITPIRDKNEESYDVGIYSFGWAKGGAGDTVKQSFINAYSNSRNIYYSLVGLLTGKFSFNQMSGPIGIVSVIGEVVQQSVSVKEIVLNLLNLTAFISINLGLFNLIPFPALDGSKLVILAVEGIRRKAIPPEKEAFISLVGLALLIMLMIFATYNDVLRLFGKQ
jgi:regulator of sigma E protease